MDISARCKAERERTNPAHKYIGNYPCERTEKYERRARNRGRRRKLGRTLETDIEANVLMEGVGAHKKDNRVGLFVKSNSWQF